MRRTILYIITQSELGGAQRYVFDLVNSLKDEFKVLVAFGEQGGKGELAKRLEEINVDYYVVPYLVRKISLISDIAAFFNLLKLINKIKPDVVHLNSSKVSILGSLAAFLIKKIKKKNLLIVYTAHGWVFNEPLSFIKKVFYEYIEKFTAYFKDKIICVSEFDYQVALNKNIIPQNKLVVIYNSIPELSFYPKEKARLELASLIKKDLDNKLVIGSIGNLYPNKGFKYLIKAAKKIVKYNPDTIFVIIGDGIQRKFLEDIITKNGLLDNVFLVGRIKSAWKLLKGFDVYVCSSLKEGLSYTILEAMQAARPIVATNVGGNAELIRDNVSGFLVKTKDYNSLSEKIKILIDDPSLREKVGEKAKNNVQQHFSFKKMIQKTKMLYLRNMF